jgi:hypothetical protein
MLKKSNLIATMEGPARNGQKNFARMVISWRSSRDLVPRQLDLGSRRMSFAWQFRHTGSAVAFALGSNIMFLDGTHNTTMYEGLVLTTLLVRDQWGHGKPSLPPAASHVNRSHEPNRCSCCMDACFNTTQETVVFFLQLTRNQSPSVIPRWIMSDRDLAQIAACSTCYLESTVLLCWWHVLHAWQRHFVISHNR